MIFGERLVSTWQLHKHHLCLSFAPHQLHHTRWSARTQTQTLLRCSVNSAAPLTLYTYTSCTQTFHRVNTQRSTPNTKWAAHAGTKPAITFYLEYQLQTTFPKNTCNGFSVAHIRNVCCTGGETGRIRYKCPSFKIPVVIPLLPPPLPLKRHIVQQESSAVSRQDRCPQCWIIWPQRRPRSIQLMSLLHWKRQEKFKAAFCGILKEELRGQAFHFTVLLSTNSGCWYVNV